LDRSTKRLTENANYEYDLDSYGGHFSYGAILGLSAGLSPGPLLAVVITQTLRHGSGEGIKVALAPLITDIPIIGVALLCFFTLPDLHSALALISYAGAAFVLLLGINSLRAESFEDELSRDPPRSYAKGILVNALSPHPYLFWFLVGVPLIIKAGMDSIQHSLVFVVTFYFCLVGAKLIIALLAGQSRGFLSGAVYRWMMRVIGLCLIVFSIQLFREGIILSGTVY